jgi:uncharacterized membrane protein SpoIIM required for sporulation
MKILIRHKIFFRSLTIAFSFWLLPFLIRIFFVEMPEINVDKIENQPENLMTKIMQSLIDDDKYTAFTLIFKNNLKGCILNIIGGVMLGIGTLFNILFNGFFSADIFVSSYKAGLSITSILKVTLPHSFELIGFWLSGAIGFYIAWNMIQFMRGTNSFSSHFYKQVGIGSAVVFIIILLAAYIEAYISTSFI